MIVVDASALFEALLPSSAGRAVRDRLFDPDEELHSPHLIDVEVAHAVRRFVRIGDIDADRGGNVLEYLSALPLVRYPHQPLLPRIWSLRNSLSAHDAAYVALAEILDAPLVTRDRRLAASVGHSARVELA